MGPVRNLLSFLLLLSTVFVCFSCEQKGSSGYVPLYDPTPAGYVPFASGVAFATDDTDLFFTQQELDLLNDSTPTYSEFRDVKLGAQFDPSLNGTAFRFFCPDAAKVILCLYDSAQDPYDQPDRILPMHSSKSGIWYVGTKAASPVYSLKYYRFRIEDHTGQGLVDYRGVRLTGAQTVVQDPYARANVRSDGHSIIIDPRRTSLQEKSPWVPTSFLTPKAEDLIIYELHVGDFTKKASSNSIPGVSNFPVAYRGKYLGLEYAIPYLKNLGINAVELMPVHEFTTDNPSDPHGYSWGYLPVLFFAPESGYATDETDGSSYYQLRKLIDEFHKNGIAVILDVVLTHTSNLQNILYWIDPKKRYYFHLNGNDWASLGTGNWIAEGERYDGVIGGAEKVFAKKLVLDNLRYWVEEFNVDGFRFDLIVGTSRSTLELARSELTALNPNIFLTSENWLGSYRHKWLVGNGYSQWNDFYRESAKTRFLGELNDATTGTRIRQSIYFSKDVDDGVGFLRAKNPVDVTNYLESHDEQTVGNFVNGSWAKAGIGITLLMTSLGIPMVYEGQEFVRDLSKSQQQSQQEDVQAIDWSLASTRQEFYEYFQFMVHLRKNNPGFRVGLDPGGGYRTDIVHTGGNLAVGYVIDENQSYGSSFVVLLNMHNYGVTFTLPPGSWKAQCAVLGNSDPYNNTQLVFLGDGRNVPSGNDFDNWAPSSTTWVLDGYSAVVLKRQ
ncbi:MAG: hypothetical protein D6805_04955 [Planctomycetota bacterium]|nr:MAG: hypothetical protein D6805_04955 [Planctomycetota bacterium]